MPPLAAEYAAAVVNGGGGGLLGSDVNKVGDVSYDLSDDPVSPLPDVPVVLRSSQDPWVRSTSSSIMIMMTMTLMWHAGAARMRG